MIFEYAGLRFNDDVPDDNGALWYIHEWDGWAGPGMRQTFANPTGQDGAILVESLLDTRTISLRGVCKAGTEEAFWASYNRLIALTNNTNEARELIVYESSPKMVRCYRLEPPVIDFVGVGSFTFEIMLTCPDPLKYSIDQSSLNIGPGSTGVVTNTGTYFTPPTIIGGGAVSVQVVNTGETISTRANVTVPAGTVFDHRTRTVTFGNVSFYDRLDSKSVWWRLSPGSNLIKNLGTGTIQINHYNAGL